MNPGLTNGLWISQWTANSDADLGAAAGFMACCLAVSDQTGITFAVASLEEARKSLSR